MFDFFKNKEQIYLQILDTIDNRSYLENLTELEMKVFFYMCKQYKYNEIADILNEPSKKIDNAIQRVRKKVLGYLKEYSK
ncbi:MAG: hypothetical protein RR523_08215 [Cetobacterium sp.]|uniref:sigma factor-like helix-turn-helix DNA-binding protein n=1 Tax=Cetobacterium sp. TaxID=2071632 RepID=UPI002FC71704